MQQGPIDRRRHRALAGASRVRVLEALRAGGGALTAANLAEQLGLHPNTVRLHLDQLTDAGLVHRERARRSGPGRPHLLFEAVAPDERAGEHASAGEDGYRLLATVLAGHLAGAGNRAADEAVAAGRAWGRSRTPAAADRPVGPVTAGGAVEHLIGMLDELGFAPSARRPDGAVDLHRCPFLQVAQQHSDVVCGVHLGLMQGALDELGAPVQATDLQPFVAPGRCRVHLATAVRPPADHPAAHRRGSTAAGPTEGLLP